MATTKKTEPEEPVAAEQTDQEYIAELEAENDTLRRQLEETRAQLGEAQEHQVPQANTRPVPHKPSFGMSEGTREELDRTGKAIDPFTGARLVKDGEDVREVDEDEFNARKPSA